MGVKRPLAGSLALAGGALMVASGYSSRGFLYMALGYAEPRISEVLSGTYASAAGLAIVLVEGVIALGGLTVMAAGLAVVLRFTAVGRVLIWLGGGAGFLGLVVGLGYSAYKLGGIGPVLGYLLYWVGLALAITGRKLAKGA